MIIVNFLRDSRSEHIFISQFIIHIAGRTCQPIRSLLLSHMSDNFDDSIKPVYWPRVDGGGVGYGCGPLHPLGHGSNLYFSGCGLRQAITAELDTTKAR